MALLAAAAALALAAAASWLLWRTLAVREAVWAALGNGRTPGRERLTQVIADQLDEMLPAALDAPQLELLALSFREHQDPYTNVAEALAWANANWDSDNVGTLCEVIKAAYQAGHAASIPAATVSEALAELAERLKQRYSGQGQASRAVFLEPGSLVDQQFMVPLNYGTRVAYPLGLVVIDATGKACCKGKVLCE